MNTNYEIINVYKSIFKAVSQNKNLFIFQINEMGSPEPNIESFQIWIDTIEEIEIVNNPVSLNLIFYIWINFEFLTKEYTKLFQPNNSDVEELIMTKQSTNFCNFLQKEWFNVIQHLKAFNHNADNYAEIAILLNKRKD
jgi:hypothetical protein